MKLLLAHTSKFNVFFCNLVEKYDWFALNLLDRSFVLLPFIVSFPTFLHVLCLYLIYNLEETHFFEPGVQAGSSHPLNKIGFSVFYKTAFH